MPGGIAPRVLLTCMEAAGFVYQFDLLANAKIRVKQLQLFFGSYRYDGRGVVGMKHVKEYCGNDDCIQKHELYSTSHFFVVSPLEHGLITVECDLYFLALPEQ